MFLTNKYKISISQLCGIYFSFLASAGKIFLRNKDIPFCLISSIKAYSQVFVKNKYGNVWFRRLQKSTEKTFVLKHFRNFILIGAVNFKAVSH